MVYQRRSVCAFPGCQEGRVFPTLKEGNAHTRAVHGLRVRWPRWEKGVAILDPTAHPRRKRGHAKDFAPTPEEYGRLLDAARDKVDRVAFRVLGEAGLRAGEFLHLRRSWLREGILHIPYEDSVTGWRGKTPRAARSIPLRAMAPEAWEIVEEAELPMGISAVTLWQRVRKGGVRAGLPRRVFPHALRAMAATTWAYRLSSPFTLMNLMGWATLDVAMAYVAVMGRGLEDAVNAWNRASNNGQHHGADNGRSVPSLGSPRLT